MGRKRKTRWRRLSIGETSANEEEDVEGSTIGGSALHGMLDNVDSDARILSGKLVGGMNNGKLTKSLSLNGDTSSPISSYNNMLNGTNSSSSTSSINSQHHQNQNNYSSNAPPPHHHQHYSSPKGPPYNNPRPNGYNGHHNQQHHHSHHHQNGHYNGGRHHYNNHYANSTSSATNGSNADASKEYAQPPPTGNNQQNNHHVTNGGPPPNNYYSNGGGRHHYHSSGPRPHYNNGGGSTPPATTTTAANPTSNGQQSNDPNAPPPTNQHNHYSSRNSSYHYNNHHNGGSRFRKPRPYGSYYHSNTTSAQDGTNRPSYNQDEYTKITTPRQDVLFKKGYLTQKKTPSSGGDSGNSTTTTPTASTNGTPDTQSTNGVHSDYSEGYENGETDCGIPYDDTIYYGSIPEAVFTDPHTGQLYYGHCSAGGEYYDAYPMMVAGYPPPMYYHMPYQAVDWNGMPTGPMYPVIAPMPLEEHLIPTTYKTAESLEVITTSPVDPPGSESSEGGSCSSGEGSETSVNGVGESKSGDKKVPEDDESVTPPPPESLAASSPVPAPPISAPAPNDSGKEEASSENGEEQKESSVESIAGDGTGSVQESVAAVVKASSPPASRSPSLEKDKSAESKAEEEKTSEGNNADDGSTSTLESVPGSSPDPLSSGTEGSSSSSSPTLEKSSDVAGTKTEAPAKSGTEKSKEEEAGNDGEKSEAGLTKAPTSFRSVSSTVPSEKAVPFVPAGSSGALSSTTSAPPTTQLPQSWAHHPGHHHPQGLHNGYGHHHGNGVGMPVGPPPHPGMTIMSAGGPMQAPIPHYHHHHPHHPPPHHGGPPQPMMPGMGAAPGSTFIPVTASNQHPNSHMIPAPAYPPQHHLGSVPPPFIYPHPGGFVYGPPIYNGVVVPYGGGAVSSLEYPPHSRKKRKKRRRKKDGQWIDEGTDESDGGFTNEDFQYYYDESLNTEEIYPAAAPYQTSYHHQDPVNFDPNNINEYGKEQLPGPDPAPTEPGTESDSVAKEPTPAPGQTETQTEPGESVPKIPTYSEQARKATKKTVLNMDAKVFVQKSSVSKSMSAPLPNPPPSDFKVKEGEKPLKVVAVSEAEKPARISNDPASRKSPEEPKWETKRFGRNAKKSSQVINSPTKKPEEPAPYVREPRRWSSELNSYRRVDEPRAVARKPEEPKTWGPSKKSHGSSSSSKESSPVRPAEPGKKFKETKVAALVSKSGTTEPDSESHETTPVEETSEPSASNNAAASAETGASVGGSEQSNSVETTPAPSGTSEAATSGHSIEATPADAKNLTDCTEMNPTEEEDKNEVEINSISGYSSSSRRSLQKPSDLVMPIPSIDSQGDLNLLHLQQSPDSLGNEPSSPDSFNTNQSVAGSEVAIGDTLSMSESDVLNRTTSIDEVEEDLPHESYFESYNSSVADLSTLPGGGSSIASTTVQEEDTTPAREQDSEIATASASYTSHHVPRPPSSETPSAPSQNKRPDEQDLNPATDVMKTGNSKADETLMSQLVTPPSPPPEAVVIPELFRTEPPTLLISPRPDIIESLRLDPYYPEENVPHASGSAEEAKTPVPAPYSPADRPKSITLAVSEWLKTQGDDALTPIISSDDNDHTPEEDDDLDVEDDGDDEEEDEDFELSRRTIEETCSKLNGQNQKNVLGNPWAAPSNKLEPGKKRRLFMTLTSRRNPTYGFRVLLQSCKNLPVPTTASSDGDSSRVAPSSLTGNACKTGNLANASPAPTSQSGSSASDENSKTKQLQNPSSKLSNYDSGLELSSPENRGNKRRNRSRRARQAQAAATAASSTKTQSPPPSPDSSMSSQDLPNSILSVSAVSKLLSDAGTAIVPDEEDKSELLCNPRNFSCYYQLGVVCDDASSSTPDTDVPEPQFLKPATTLTNITETAIGVPASNPSEPHKTSVQKFYTVSLNEPPTPPEINPGYKTTQKVDIHPISSTLRTENSSDLYAINPLPLPSEPALVPDTRRPSIESEGTDLSSTSEEIPEYVPPTTEFSSVINQRTAPNNIIRNRFISPTGAQNALLPSTVCCVIQ